YAWKAKYSGNMDVFLHRPGRHLMPPMKYVATSTPSCRKRYFRGMALAVRRRADMDAGASTFENHINSCGLQYHRSQGGKSMHTTHGTGRTLMEGDPVWRSCGELA